MKIDSRTFVMDRCDPAVILNALPAPVIVVDEVDRIALVNPAAEQFFDSGANTLLGRSLSVLLPDDSTVTALIRQVRGEGRSISESAVTIDTLRAGVRYVSVEVAPLSDGAAAVVISLHERAIARKLDRQLGHRNAARSVAAMAALLAHEVKNPLSGIRGAAQLLEQNAGEEDRAMTRLICEETDRIVALVDRMDLFADDGPMVRRAVNIHQVLDRVAEVAAAGFAQGLQIVKNYDPSLPPVDGHRDLLVQALLNLVKNAAEVVPPNQGRIELMTRYRQGVRLAVPGSGARVELPLEISVIDNGPGVSPELAMRLFEPFVSSKSEGRGLGLSLVAKVVGDHGGVVEFDRQPGATVFRLMLPAADDRAGNP
jgi:two-component system, NtrC family, nitrogen regulation sensor histidine kinase GlnL